MDKIRSKRSKIKDLEGILKELGSVVVAFSGGLDSTFILKIAKDTLNGRVVAVTARSETYPLSEFKESKHLAKSIGAPQIVIKTDELKKKNFSSNPPQRCYWCKSELFKKMEQVRRRLKFNHIIDGTNLSDKDDFRPGARAEEEFNVKRPLLEAGFTKPEIRKYSKQLGLPTYSKPAMACLASRFPYYSEITGKKLEAIEKAEEYLKSLNFCWIRVRHHDEIVRIEVGKNEIDRFFSKQIRDKVVKKFKQLGFRYVTLDIEGYRTGSMNEVLEKN